MTLRWGVGLYLGYPRGAKLPFQIHFPSGQQGKTGYQQSIQEVQTNKE
jgi:hypothetical protein